MNEKKNKCVVFVPSDILINPGDTYVFSGKFSKVDSSRTDLFAENFDLLYYYNDNDIVIKRLPSYRIRLKKRIEKTIQALYRPQTAPVIKALLLGNQNDVSKEKILIDLRHQLLILE